MPVDASTGMDAARKAARMRAGWLTALAQERASVAELLLAATHVDGKPLRKIRLDDLMGAALGVKTRSRDLMIAKIRVYADVPDTLPDKDMTVAWLLRNNGHAPTALRRTGAMLDAMASTTDARTELTAGFPFDAPQHLRDAWS